MAWEYRIAAAGELARLWEKNVARHPHDPRWGQWAQEYQEYNQNGMAVTFAALVDGEPVGEATLLLSPGCRAVGGCLALADGHSVGNVNALRIEKQWEGQGHISRLVRVLESHAKAIGLQALTIEVEPQEALNLAIYLHWGYQGFVRAQEEGGCLVLCYRKAL